MKVGILAPKFNKENLCAFLMLTADGVVKGMRMELSSLLLMGMHIFFLFVFLPRTSLASAIILLRIPSK